MMRSDRGRHIVPMILIALGHLKKNNTIKSIPIIDQNRKKNNKNLDPGAF